MYKMDSISKTLELCRNHADSLAKTITVRGVKYNVWKCVVCHTVRKEETR